MRRVIVEYYGKPPLSVERTELAEEKDKMWVNVTLTKKWGIPDFVGMDCGDKSYHVFGWSGGNKNFWCIQVRIQSFKKDYYWYPLMTKDKYDQTALFLELKPKDVVQSIVVKGMKPMVRR